jgi:hypothetical protein
MLGSTLPFLAQRPFDPLIPAAVIVMTVLALNVVASELTRILHSNVTVVADTATSPAEPTLEPLGSVVA